MSETLAGEFGGWSISERLFADIRRRLPAGGVLVELGSGPASRHLAETYTLYSIEEDAEYAAAQWEHIQQTKGHWQLCHAPLVRPGGRCSPKWYDVDALRRWLPHACDGILIDGPRETPFVSRAGLAFNLELFCWYGPVWIDDVHRVSGAVLLKALEQHLKREAIVHTEQDKAWAVLPVP